MWGVRCLAFLLALSSFAQELPRVRTVDYRESAGVVRDGKLEAAIDIVEGRWYPEAEDGKPAVIQAFAEAGKSPQNPGPLLRVREGQSITLTLHNRLDTPASIFGLRAIGIFIAPDHVGVHIGNDILQRHRRIFQEPHRPDH